ncbi:RDD family protein [Sphingomicrobium sediminis]|uniref:RDD family protein n=1 Tax=Sphingomicrobium sediminis TaxID=2950949 RepID=A0A9X2EN23_9SPHN|nr:RDD family protein [Sphingomicrobium sediminis]MCM8558439.1 RDD family protein [Sphingomicrobium sediminis]
MKQPVRRLAAFGFDYLLIACWAVFVGLVSVATGLHENLDMSSWAGRAGAHLVGFLSLTLPVIAYFALTEGGPKRASLGKRALKLQVEGNRTWLRNIVKFLPWEIAHAAIWWQDAQPFVDPMPPTNMAVSVAAMLIGLAYVASLFVGDGRTPYDRLAGTRVTR